MRLLSEFTKLRLIPTSSGLDGYNDFQASVLFRGTTVNTITAAHTVGNDDIGTTLNVGDRFPITITIPEFKDLPIGASFNITQFDTGGVNIVPADPSIFLENITGDNTFVDMLGEFAEVKVTKVAAKRWRIVGDILPLSQITRAGGGTVSSAGVMGVQTGGYNSSTGATGVYTITSSLSTYFMSFTAYTANLTPTITAKGSGTMTVEFRDAAGVLTNTDFDFVVSEVIN